MTDRKSNRSGHLPYGDVLRYIDGEGTAREEAEWSAHLAECATCQNEVGSLRDDAATVTRWLETADFEAALGAGEPLARRRPPPPAHWWKAAAAILLVAGPLAAVPDVRAWVAERLAPPPTPTSAATSRGAEQRPAAVVRFAPPGATLPVRVSDATGATLQVRRGQGDDVRVTLTGASADAVFSRSTLVLRGGAGDRYTLELPADVAEIRLVYDDAARSITDEEIAAGWSGSL